MPYLTSYTPDEVLTSCWWHLAHQDLEQRTADYPEDPIDDAHRWLQARAARWQLDHQGEARQILANRPDLGVEQLAETIRMAAH